MARREELEISRSRTLRSWRALAASSLRFWRPEFEVPLLSFESRDPPDTGLVGLRGQVLNVGDIDNRCFETADIGSVDDMGLEELAVSGVIGDEFCRHLLFRGVTSMDDMLAVLV